VFIRPDADGPHEQRYLHFGSPDAERVLLETRNSGAGKWHHDSFVASSVDRLTLIDSAKVHDSGNWFHVAFVVGDGYAFTYVNSALELGGEVRFVPLVGGETSVGVRMNRVSWFKG